MKKPYLLLTCLFVVLVILSVVRITLVNSISTTGKELVDLEAKINTLKKQNALLQEQYLQAASYTNISLKAKTMGFAQAKSQLNMAAPLPLALR